MENENIHNIIGLVLSGTASEHEKELLKSWLEESPGNILTYRALEQAWKSTKMELSYSHEEEQCQKVISRIQSPKRSRWERSRRGSAKNMLRIAAAASILFVFAWILFTVQHGTNEVKTIEAKPPVVKSAPAGSKLHFHLPDGTKVWLNSESVLKYSGSYGTTDRQVALIGEAYFDVVEDRSRAFIVSSANFRTIALGTAFNVCAFPGKELNISLVEGKVKVAQYGQGPAEEPISQVLLLPGEQISWHEERNVLEKRAFNPMKVVAWKDNILHFEDTDFHDVIDQMTSWYGVKFTVINPPAKNKTLFSGTFRNKSLEHVLEAMSFSRKISYDIRNDTTVLIKVTSPI